MCMIRATRWLHKSLDSGSLSRKLAGLKRPNDSMRLSHHLLSCKLVSRCCKLTSWGFSEVSASFSHLCRRGFSLHMFLKLSCRASKRQIVVWLNILPANTQKQEVNLKVEFGTNDPFKLFL